ncbi:MAG: AMP-binding protein, partial [bacterium]|nr:AMP-binding protein [bacterium]
AHLNTLAQENGTTLNLVVQTIWGMLLMRYNNSRDVVFGAVVSGRPAGLEGIESMVGLFINTVPVRITAGSQQGGQFLKLLETLHANTTKTNAYEYQSLAEVQARSALKSRLFDHIMIFENYPVAEELEQSTKAHGLPFELYASDTREQTNYSFNIVVVPGKRLKIKFHYNASVYDTQLVENARLHLNQIISQVTENPGILTEDIEIITEKEKQQILYEFNNTAADFPKDKTIYQLFEEQVERTPGSISIVGSGQYAVVNEKIKDKTKSKKEIKDNKKIKNKKQTKDQLLQMGGADYTLQDVIPNVGGIHESPSSTPSGIQYPASGIQHPASSIQSIPSFPSFPSTPSTQSTQSIQLTYRELNNKANRLADLLQSKGVKPGTIVAIMTERNVEMITALLGILKAGGAYLPIDTGYPEARVNYMLADSNTKIVLKGVNKAGEQDQEPSHKKGIEIIDLNELSKNEDQEKGDKRQPTPGSRPPLPGFAYIIYTSGTTGKPKGTIVAHPSLVNLCLWYTGYYNFTERDRSTQYASIGFDASVFEIFPTLIKGAALHIIADEHRLDIHRLKKYYTKNNITLSMLPTQFCQTFTEDAMEIPTLRCLMTGGEKLVHFTPRHYALYNNYGPTENTVSTTAYHVTEQKVNIPIGKPIANNRVYILDRTSRHLQPIGIPGELCIGGDSLAIGYLNSPELTAKRFAKASRQLAVGSWQGKDSKQLAVGSWQKEKIKEQKERAKEPEKGSPSKLTPTAPLNKSLWESGTLSSERV